jgi:hypothetical protein
MTLKKIDVSTIKKAVKNCTTPTQKTIMEKIDISSKWETQLPLYLDLYSRLSNDGKKEMQRQVKIIGALVDVQCAIKKMRKEKNE